MSSSPYNTSFNPQVETPASQQPPHRTLSTDRDCIARDKQRLQRFHKEAMSFLSKAYSNDQTSLIEDRFDNPASAARSHDDLLSQRKVEVDRVRLERFHAQAVSFLDRAYANEPGTIIVEESLSPRVPNALEEDKVMLKKFHEEAMSFLDAAAAGESGHAHRESYHVEGEGLNVSRASWRIERDKKRLEQHYQDAMSFLDRVETERGGGFVEEQELEPAHVDRLQLQRYAQDAMSFLDKAFRNDASVMIGDEEELLAADGGGRQYNGKESADDDRFQDAEIEPMPKARRLPAARKHHLDSSLSQDAEAQCDEEKQIAADRAALERYDEEFGDFLSKAYLDDSTVIVEDADSETSGTERGLFARRMAPSTTSGGTPHSERSTLEEFSEDEYTDDDFQDPPGAESAQMESLRRALPAQSLQLRDNSSGSNEDVGGDENAAIRLRMMHYEREAADYLDGANVSVDEEYDDNNADEVAYPGFTKNMSSSGDAQLSSHEQHAIVQDHDCRRHEIVDEVEDDDDEEFGADRHIDDESIPKGFYDDKNANEDGESTPKELQISVMKFPDRVEMSERDAQSLSRDAETPWHPQNRELFVDVIVEDKTGRSCEWPEVPLEKSFYRQVPRGSTIKLRPRVSPRLSSSNRAESNGMKEGYGSAFLSELQRVEKERDALMATLEEIINERSMLAAQVREMKAMITNAGGDNEECVKTDTEMEYIDLGAELHDAHATMAKLTEEMEATLSVLDNRYQTTLERAHKAEEKCIRLETDAARMENEFSKQGMRLSQALSEENRLTALLNKSEREMDLLRKKAESDMQRIDDAHREEVDRSVRKILELTTEISVLQEKVKSGASTSAERGLNSPQRKLELEIAGLKRRVAESDRKLADEKFVHREALQTELQKTGTERQQEIQLLNSQIEKLQIEVQTAELAKRDLRRSKAETSRLTGKVEESEREIKELKLELKDEKRDHLTAEAEAAHIRARFEESLKKRMARIDQEAEIMELEAALAHYKEEAAARERRLQQQLSEFWSRAEQAETAAFQAENGAKEAVEAAKIAQERSRAAVEAERKARQQAEMEKQAAIVESKKWERIAIQQTEAQMSKEEKSNEDVTKSSSRRGLRKSPSKNGVKEAGRKKKEYRGGGSEEGGKKKVSLRPRFFG